MMEDFEVRATQETLSEDEDDQSVAEVETSETPDTANATKEQSSDAGVVGATQSEVRSSPTYSCSRCRSRVEITGCLHLNNCRISAFFVPGFKP